MARRAILQAELDHFEVDEEAGKLYWRGKGIALESKVSLEGWTFVLAVVGALSTVVAAAWPILDHFWL